jgi:hypothetical protein
MPPFRLRHAAKDDTNVLRNGTGRWPTDGTVPLFLARPPVCRSAPGRSAERPGFG